MMSLPLEPPNTPSPPQQPAHSGSHRHGDTTTIQKEGRAHIYTYISIHLYANFYRVISIHPSIYPSICWPPKRREYTSGQDAIVIDVSPAHTHAHTSRKVGPEPEPLAFTRYCYYQYCMLNGETWGPGGNRLLRNVDYTIHPGGLQYRTCWMPRIVLTSAHSLNEQTNIL